MDPLFGQDTEGTIQDPFTSVTEPLEPVTAKPLQLVLHTVPEGQLKALRAELTNAVFCGAAYATTGKKAKAARTIIEPTSSVLENSCTAGPPTFLVYLSFPNP